MEKLLLFIFLFATLQTIGQYDYELFQQYNDKSSLEQNRKIRSITESQLLDKGKWTKTFVKEFNVKGLPTLHLQFDQQGKELEKKEFLYNDLEQISKIETYKGGLHYRSTEFEVNTNGQITSYADYVYSSLSGKKMDLSRTSLTYNSNQTLKEVVETQSNGNDTIEINFYDTLGIVTKSLWNKAGLRTKKILYVWNEFKTEMKELHYENDTSVYDTIIHKYKNNKEVERNDPSISLKPFYWKYNKGGRVIETNEGLFYVLYFKYDKYGRIKNKIVNVLLLDSNEKNLPKKIRFKYEFENR